MILKQETMAAKNTISIIHHKAENNSQAKQERVHFHSLLLTFHNPA
jgi:hypothetical protein